MPQVSVQEVKQRLTDYREREKYLDMEIERLDRMEDKLTSAGSPTISDMPKAPSAVQDRMAALIAVKVDLENEISEEIKFQQKERQYIEGVVKKLRKAEEKVVIKLRYIDGQSWNDIVDILFAGKEDFIDKEDSYLRRVHKAHGMALENMAIIISQE